MDEDGDETTCLRPGKAPSVLKQGLRTEVEIMPSIGKQKRCFEKRRFLYPKSTQAKH
jgi:hypothetical protein